MFVILFGGRVVRQYTCIAFCCLFICQVVFQKCLVGYRMDRLCKVKDTVSYIHTSVLTRGIVAVCGSTKHLKAVCGSCGGLRPPAKSVNVRAHRVVEGVADPFDGWVQGWV